mmetsp:Transcript_95181/g.268979  ORF Transcript_95181/g.268979 Transcript_95181/m.268979 type:complete len:236 (+) Transcript_95181:38-745(+)
MLKPPAWLVFPGSVFLNSPMLSISVSILAMSSVRLRTLPYCTKQRPSTQTCVTSRRFVKTSAPKGSKMGAVSNCPRSTATRSAAFPTLRLPVTSSRPNAFAPLIVAIRRASSAGKAVGSHVLPFANIEAYCISVSMSKVLLEAAPSVPRHTFTPACSILITGGMPDPSLRLLLGLCATLTPRAAKSATSSSVMCTQCAQTVPLASMPTSSNTSTALLPAFSSRSEISFFVSCMWV